MLKARDFYIPDAFLKELEEMSEVLAISQDELVAEALSHYIKTVIARGDLDLNTIERSNEPISRLLFDRDITPSEVLIDAIAEYKTHKAMIHASVRQASKTDLS